MPTALLLGDGSISASIQRLLSKCIRYIACAAKRSAIGIGERRCRRNRHSPILAPSAAMMSALAKMNMMMLSSRADSQSNCSIMRGERPLMKPDASFRALPNFKIMPDRVNVVITTHGISGVIGVMPINIVWHLAAMTARRKRT